MIGGVKAFCFPSENEEVFTNISSACNRVREYQSQGNGQPPTYLSVIDPISAPSEEELNPGNAGLFACYSSVIDYFGNIIFPRATCYGSVRPAQSSISLTLTPAPKQKDPHPLKAEGKDGKSTYELIARVMEGSTPKAGVVVTFAAEPIANSGGHDHHDASRPKGTVTPNSPKTDANGEIKVTFQASQIAGTHVVAAVCESCTNKSVTKNVDVKVPDLVPFLALPFRTQQWNPAGIGQTVEHLDNHYLTVDATYRLLEIATKYKRIWPTAPTLTLNDASLKWGGKFDIDGSWDRFKGRHGEHRIGDNIDIRANSGPGTVPSNIRDAVFRWLRDESAEKDNIPEDLQILSVNPLWENPKEVNEHFHLRLGN